MTVPKELIDLGGVILLVENEKRPAGKWKDAVGLDAGGVQKALASGKNLGFRCGGSQNIFVIDHDSRDTWPTGYPATWTCFTPRGMHFWFRAPKDIRKNSKKKLADDIDTRGAGGYVVIPPSRIGDNEYRWMAGHAPGEIELADLPESIAAKLRADEPEEPKPKPKRKKLDNTDRRAAYAAKAIAEEVGSVANCRGNRNDALNRAAFNLGQLVAGGVLTESEVVDELTQAAQRASTLGDHPLSGSEIRNTIASGLRGGKQSPRTGPVEKSTSTSTPDPPKTKPAPGIITNYAQIGTNARDVESLSPSKITDDIHAITDGWPRRIGQRLFFSRDNDIHFCDSSDNLFSHFAQYADIRWRTGRDAYGKTLTPQKQLFERLTWSVKHYDSISITPMHPQPEEVFCAWRPPKNYTPDGRYLNELLSFFDNFKERQDRELIKAAFVTPAWGGLPGTRPAFVATSPDRGCGKSTLFETIGELYGGYFDFKFGQNKEDEIYSRVLSPRGQSKHIAIIDNVKGRASSATIETLITTPTISGRALYVGEGTRPNYMTWFLTANTPSLSRDLATRAYIIQLQYPKQRHGWEVRVKGYVKKYRDQILADIVSIYQQEAHPVESGFDRWQSWADEVLSRVTKDPAAIVAKNRERRDQYDEEIDEAAQIAEAISLRCDDLHSTGQRFDFLATREMADLINIALGTRLSTRAATGRLDEHVKAGRIKGVDRSRTSAARGYNIGRTALAQCIHLEIEDFVDVF